MVEELQTPKYMPMNVSFPEPLNKANIFLSLIEYELNSLLIVLNVTPSIIYLFIFDSALEDIR